MATWTQRAFRGNPYVTITAISVTGGIAASRTSATVPAFFQLSASAITATGTSLPFEDLEYRWEVTTGAEGTEDFATAWMVVSVAGEALGIARSMDTDQVGPEAVFCFRTAGTKTVTLTIRGADGEGGFVTETTTIDLTVSAWSGTDYYFDPVDGDDTNDGLSDAAPKKTWTAYRTLATGGNNRRLLGKSGTTMAADSNSMTLTERTGIRLDTYGGSEPFTLQAATGITLPVIRYNINSASSGGDHVFSNLIIDGGGIQSPCRGSGSGSASGELSWIYFDNCQLTHDDATGGDACISLGIGEPVGTVTGFGLWKTTLHNTGGTVAKHCMFIGGGGVDWQFMMGGSCIGDGQSDVLDHHLYVNFGEHACYRFISFGAATTRNYCMNTNRPNDASTDHRYVLIADNHFNGNGGPIRGIDISNVSNDQTAAPVTDLVIEGNVFHEFTDDVLFAYTWNGTVRDNIFYNNTRNLRQNGDHNPFRWYANKSYVGSGVTADTSTHEIDDDNQSAWLMKGNENHDEREAARIMAVSATDAVNADLDENSYYAPNDTDPFYDDDGATAEDSAGWQALGFDAAGTFGTDPGWNDPANGDFSTDEPVAGGTTVLQRNRATRLGSRRRAWMLGRAIIG